MFSEISEWRRVKLPSEIYWPGDLLPYTIRGVSRKYALLLGLCSVEKRATDLNSRTNCIVYGDF